MKRLDLSCADITPMILLRVHVSTNNFLTYTSAGDAFAGYHRLRISGPRWFISQDLAKNFLGYHRWWVGKFPLIYSKPCAKIGQYYKNGGNIIKREISSTRRPECKRMRT